VISAITIHRKEGTNRGFGVGMSTPKPEGEGGRGKGEGKACLLSSRGSKGG